MCMVNCPRTGTFLLLTFTPISLFSSRNVLRVSRYSVMFTSLLAQMGMSSPNLMYSGTSFLTYSVITSTSMRNMYGLTADPWCNRISTLKHPPSPAALRTFVYEPLYMPRLT